MTGDGKNTDKQFIMDALIDSEANGTFLDKKFALKNRIALAPLERKVIPFNIDGTKNKSGIIEHCTWLNLTIEKKKIPVRFLITDLGKEMIILGLSWLEDHNPKIDWDQYSMDISSIKSKISFGHIIRTFDISRMITILTTLKPTAEEIPDDELLQKNPLPFDGLILMQIDLNRVDEEEIDIQNLRSFLENDDEEDEEEEEEQIWVQAKRSISQDLVQKLEAEKPKNKVELPETFKDY